jgi:imidazole glycerol phosphate synthase subunit HisF
MKAKIKKATIVAMAAIAASNVSEETMAMESAMQDMADEYGHECIIIDMDPFDGLIA